MIHIQFYVQITSNPAARASSLSAHLVHAQRDSPVLEFPIIASRGATHHVPDASQTRSHGNA